MSVAILVITLVFRVGNEYEREAYATKVFMNQDEARLNCGRHQYREQFADEWIKERAKGWRESGPEYTVEMKGYKVLYNVPIE